LNSKNQVISSDTEHTSVKPGSPSRVINPVINDSGNNSVKTRDVDEIRDLPSILDIIQVTVTPPVDSPGIKTSCNPSR